MEANEFNYSTQMTKPGGGFEAPLPKRQSTRTLIPLSWLGRPVALSYSNGHGHDVTVARGTILDWCVLGVLMTVGGKRLLVNFDQVVAIELSDD